jgi:adenylate cyclase
MSKRYGVSLVVGAETAEAAARTFLMVELDLISVKGRQGAAPIYAAIGPRTGDAEEVAFLADHAAMLAAYRAQRFDEAFEALAACRSHWPTRRLP